MSDANTGQQAPKSRLKNGCLIGVAVILGIGILGSIVGDDKPSSANSANSSSPDAPAKTSAAEVAETPDVTTTAREIFDAYQTNQIAAGNRFSDKSLEVSGRIQKIDEAFGEPVIQLETSNQFMPLGAYFPDDAADMLASLSPGKKVTVLCGKVQEAASFVTLRDCTLKPVP